MTETKKNPKLCMVTSGGAQVEMFRATTVASVLVERALLLKHAVDRLKIMRDDHTEMAIFAHDPGKIDDLISEAETISEKLVEVFARLEDAVLVSANDVVATVLGAEVCDCPKCVAARINKQPLRQLDGRDLVTAVNQALENGADPDEAVAAAMVKIVADADKGKPNA